MDKLLGMYIWWLVYGSAVYLASCTGDDELLFSKEFVTKYYYEHSMIKRNIISCFIQALLLYMIYPLVFIVRAMVIVLIKLFCVLRNRR